MSNTNIGVLSDSKIQSISNLVGEVKTNEEFEDLKNKLLRENICLNDEINAENNFNEIVGANKSLKEILNKINMVADTNATVLIRGETGTGKELIARSIHSKSTRNKRPLIKVNCAAIPTGLLESELFGHEKGSFTGAISQKIGKFEQATGGTIFLDEIGDLQLDAQAKLLRILQEQEFERIGGNETHKVDIRVIAATNRDLERAVKDKNFRIDLYFRLNVFPIELPSLRERIDDIPALSDYFLSKYSKKVGKQINIINEKTLKNLSNYNWPGNIRELENIIERAVIICTDGILNINEDQFDSYNSVNIENNINAKLEDVERNHIIKILNRTEWQIHGKSGAARILDVNPSTLRSKMSKLGIKRKSIQTL